MDNNHLSLAKMTLLKKYSLLLFLLLSGILFFLIHFFLGKRNTAEEDEVAKLNDLRREFSVPIIETNWTKEGIYHEHEKWHDGVRGINSSAPIHLYKEITFNASRIELEKDAFHFEFSDSLQYRLILYHQYTQGNSIERTKNELIIYEQGKFPPSYSRELSRETADSVLQVWKLKLSE